MAKILPRSKLKKRRTFAMAKMIDAIMKSGATRFVRASFELTNESFQYVSLKLTREKSKKASLLDLSKFTFEEVDPYHLRLVPRPDQMDDFFTQLRNHSKRPAFLTQDFQKGTAQLIIEPEDLVSSLTEIAKERGIDVKSRESEFAKNASNALADTKYLARMTRATERQPLLQ